MTKESVIDNTNLSKFHMKMTIASTAGQLCDGYLLGIIAPALPLFAAANLITPTLLGMIGAATLLGVFLGALIFGRLTDKYGRRKLFILQLFLILILSLMHWFITDATQLLIIRFLLGVAIGGDYAVAGTLISEFSPKKHRAVLMSLAPAMWTVGYVASFFIGALFVGENAWKWMLVSSAIPAFFVLLLRLTTPESPRWLAIQGRKNEALAIIKKYVNPNATLADLDTGKETHEAGYSVVLSKKYRGRLFFMSSIWVCQVFPYFAVFTYLPTIMKNISKHQSVSESLLVNTFLVVGSILGLFIVNKIGRRPLAIMSFMLLTFSTLYIAIGHSALWIIVAFSLFAMVSSGASVLDVVYPAELFPTEIRATATGICVGISRLGAALGTFLVPIGISSFGTNAVMMVASLVCGIGLLICVLYAPETRGLALDDAASVKDEDLSARKYHKIVNGDKYE